MTQYEDELQRYKRKYEEEVEIVNRCWTALGISSYSGANGLSIYEHIAALKAKVDSQLYVPPAWKHGDPERRKDNWTLLINEYAPKYDFKYKDWNGKELTFFGLVHAEDDLYYGLMDKDGKVTLASCVGSLDKAENGWYEQIPNGGRCDFCNCVFPVSGPVKCDRYRCPQGPNPLDSQCISNPTGSKDA